MELVVLVDKEYRIVGSAGPHRGGGTPIIERPASFALIPNQNRYLFKVEVPHDFMDGKTARDLHLNWRFDPTTTTLVKLGEPVDSARGCRVDAENRRDDSAFAYLRASEAVVIKRLSTADPEVGRLAGEWYEVRRLVACRCLADILPTLRSEFAELEGFPEETADAATEHLQKVLDAELEPVRDEGLEIRLDKFRVAAAQGVADEHGRIGKAFDMAFASGSTRGGPLRPFHSDDEIDKIYDGPKTKIRKSKYVFRRDHEKASTGGYWALWSTIEWPYFINDTQMLWCKEKTRWITGDKPSTLELPGGSPGGWVQKDGSVLSDKIYVGNWWDNKIYNYVPPVRQIHFPKVGEEQIFFYTCTLNNPGLFDVDWDKLQESLEEKLDKYSDGLANRVTEMLKGASIGGISLAPLGGAASAAKDALKIIVKEIIEWITNQLEGSKYPPIVVTHRIIWLHDVPWSTVTYAYAGAGDKKIAIPGPAGEAAGTDGVEWKGESQRPPKPTTNLEQVKGAPVYWAPSDDNGGHVFIPLSYKDGRYAVAVRTEVRIIAVEFT